MYTIYKINFSDGRCYVGSTCQQPWTDRFRSGYSMDIRCVDPYRNPQYPSRLVYDSIDVLEQGDDDSQRYKREDFYIQQNLDTVVNDATHATDGMTGKHLSEEARRKISESMTGDKNPFYGKRHSDETRQKMSTARKGKQSPRKGVTLSEETRMKISIANKGKQSGDKHPNYGKHLSAETRKKISESLKKRREGR